MDAAWQSEANGWVAVLKKARAAGLMTNLELVSIEPPRVAALARPCLPHLDLLVVNDHEIGAVAGEKTVTAEGTDRRGLHPRHALDLGPRIVAHGGGAFPPGRPGARSCRQPDPASLAPRAEG